MAQIGWIDDNGKNLSFDEALAISEAEGSWSSMPHEVLVLIKDQVTKVRPEGISVTQLLGCPRKVFLEKSNDWYSRPLDNWPAFRGTLVHGLLEQTGGANSEVEVRYEKEYKGITISGQPDSVRVLGSGERRLLRDWKSTGKLPFYDNAYSSHKMQTNIYRWLMDLNPRFTEIEIVYISMEGVKAIPLKKGGTTKYGRAIENQVMTDEEVETFLDDRLLTLAAQIDVGRPVAYHNVDEADLWNCNFCPVKQVCYAMAADEAQVSHAAGEPVQRVVPRKKKEKK